MRTDRAPSACGAVVSHSIREHGLMPCKGWSFAEPPCRPRPNSCICVIHMCALQLRIRSLVSSCREPSEADCSAPRDRRWLRTALPLFSAPFAQHSRKPDFDSSVLPPLAVRRGGPLPRPLPFFPSFLCALAPRVPFLRLAPCLPHVDSQGRGSCAAYPEPPKP